MNFFLLPFVQQHSKASHPTKCIWNRKTTILIWCRQPQRKFSMFYSLIKNKLKAAPQLHEQGEPKTEWAFSILLGSHKQHENSFTCMSKNIVNTKRIIGFFWLKQGVELHRQYLKQWYRPYPKFLSGCKTASNFLIL